MSADATVNHPPAMGRPGAAALSGRGEIRLGFRCNARCGFCYYQDLLDQPVEKEPTYAELRRSLEALRRLGGTEVEFTGGEPTIRRDLVTLVRDARELGFRNVSLITNGIRLARPDYARELAEAGVNDVLFSIHGADAECHDAHVSVPGSFDKVRRAFANMQALGVRCRVTCTVTGRNVHQLSRILQLFLRMSASCIHFAVFSPVAQAGATAEEFTVSYDAAAAALKAAIDRHRSELPPLSVKYIPFCYMRGYEHYVMNLYQQSFDPDDWNYYFSNRVRRAPAGIKAWLFDVVSTAGCLLARDWRVLASYGRTGLKVYGFTRLVELLRKRRMPGCRQCGYDAVCDHVWRDYPVAANFPEPLPGPPVLDPAGSYVMAAYRRPGSALTGRGPDDYIPVRDLTRHG